MRGAQENFVNLASSQQVSLNPANESQDAHRREQNNHSNSNNCKNDNNNNDDDDDHQDKRKMNKCTCECGHKTAASGGCGKVQAPKTTNLTDKNKMMMKKKKNNNNNSQQHPLDTANLLSRLFFGWMLPVIWRAYRLGLDRLAQLPSWPSQEERCQLVGERLALNWKRELNGCQWRTANPKKRPSLLRAATRTHFRCILANSMLSFFAEVVCKSSAAFSVGQILFYINNRDQTSQSSSSSSSSSSSGSLELQEEGLQQYLLAHFLGDPLIFWTWSLILSTCCWVLSAHYYGFQMMRVGLRLRIGCSYLIYLKSLKLGQFQSKQSIMGKMINLLSNDLDKFNYVCIMLPFLWIGPMQTIISLLLLWPLLGFSCLASLLCILFLLLPIQFYLSNKFASFRHQIAQQTDQRVKILNETISSIKLIKLYSWEVPFIRRLLNSRQRETKLIQRVAIWKAFSVALMYVSSKMVLFVTILFHCLLFQRPLDAKTLFMSMAMLNNVQFTMTQLMPRVISLGGESLVSLRRIGDFLLELEFEKSPKLWQSEPSRLHNSTGRRLSSIGRSLSQQTLQLDRNKLSPQGLFDGSHHHHHHHHHQLNKQREKAYVHCQSMGANWPQAERKTLESIHFRCQAPELVVVCGQVGSGKSSLLLSLLNELPISEGSARVCGQLAYASQSGWIFNGTLRENIVFGREFNEQRYRQTLEACALVKDVELFEFGDQTYVQDESLSGGQKARVNLARCLYNNSSDIYLLDDPFSALDGRVAEQIFQEALLKLLKGKLILLATHQVKYLRKCDKILLLDEGKQLAYCTYLQLGSMFLAPIGEHFTRKQHERLAFLAKCFNDLSKDDHLSNEQIINKQQVKPIDKNVNLKSKSLATNNQPKGEEETREDQSQNQARIWFKYYSMNSVWRLFFIVLSFLVTQTLFSTVDIYLTVWSMIEQNKALLIEITGSNQLWPSYIKHSLINRAYDKSTGVNDSSAIDLVIHYDEKIQLDSLATNLNETTRNDHSLEFRFNKSNNNNNNNGSAHELVHLIAQHVNKKIFAPMLDWLFYYSTSFQVDGKNISLVGDYNDTNLQIDTNFTTNLDNVSVINLDENILLESSEALNIKPIYRPLYLVVNNLTPSGHAIIYASLLLGLFICSSLTNILSLTTSNKSAKTLYKQLINSLMFARMSYFDQNPIGRFLNRATRDFGIIDEAIPYNANQAYDALLQTAATFIVVTIVDFKLALPSLVILLVFFLFHSVQVAPMKDIQRLEGIARSPILTHINSTLNGLHTIRASKAESRLEKVFIQFQDNHSSVMLFKLGCNRSTAVILDWFNALYVAIIAMVAVCSTDLSGPSAGLIITSAILLSGLTQHGIMKLIETESLMTSVERVLEYCHLPQEESPIQRNDRRPNSVITGQVNQVVWPNEGVIEYNQVDLYYDDDDNDDEQQDKRPVLKKLTFKTKPNEKIGIIGRTGAGKSSIISTLFRLYHYEGSITVDGVDLSQLNLVELRNSIGIIPQQPVLFASMSIRENLDPRGEFDDLAIWSALDKAHLRETISNLPGKLNFIVGEAGLSSGQRQLVCLARVLLRRNKIIVLDEATASVDATTDSIIQTLIRREFKECTVLTVAHRLETILDCDRIMILDSGQLIEFDSPSKLASHEDNYFAQLMAASNLQLGSN